MTAPSAGRWFVDAVKDLLGKILQPLRVLAVAGIGVVFAILLLRAEYVVVALCLGGAIALALLLDAIGTRLLPKRPRAALFLMEFWILGLGVIAAAASGVAVAVAIRLAPSDGLAAEISGLRQAIAAAVTAFLTGAFVSWVGEKDSSRISDRIKRHFYAHYDRATELPPPADGKKYFRAESPGERAVHSTEIAGVAGWGIGARWKRAQIISEELATGGSDPKRPAVEPPAQP